MYSDPLVPSDVATIEPGAAEVPLTRLNPWLDERAIAAPRALVATAADGTKLDLWVIDAAGDGPKPLVLQVHGGPHTAYGDAFFFEFQMLASHGMSVAYGNPRGSQSYGSAFSGAITGDWGGVDVEDVLAILDAAAAGGHCDPARIGLAGGSYGGFMTTLLLGRSNRFAAGVSMRAVNDFVSEAGASDVGWFLERELDAPWEADAGRRMFDLSPMRTAHLIDAPLLIEHSERDYRCPIDQGEQLFTCCAGWGRRSSSCGSPATGTTSRGPASRATACCACERSRIGSCGTCVRRASSRSPKRPARCSSRCRRSVHSLS